MLEATGGKSEGSPTSPADFSASTTMTCFSSTPPPAAFGGSFLAARDEDASPFRGDTLVRGNFLAVGSNILRRESRVADRGCVYSQHSVSRDVYAFITQAKAEVVKGSVRPVTSAKS